MAVFPEAMARLYDNVYVCKVCKHKFRASRGKVLAGKARCRNCGSDKIRPIRLRSKK